MKKKIVIIGSTGSIGKCTINIIRKNKDKFAIKALSSNKNINLIVKQAKEFNVKNIIINDKKKFLEAKKKFNYLKINFYNSFNILDKIFKKKEIFYSMISIVGIDGLIPTLKLIKFSRNIAIVNKECLVCGWSLIKKKLNFNKTNFIPIDSEHYSLNSILDKVNTRQIKNIYITASGGPFLNNPHIKKKSILVNDALKHPNWKMGKKISIDSSTLMNKVFEVIEAKNIFDVAYEKINILTHPMSYVHSIVEFDNGLIKIVAHQPKMEIPISSSLIDGKINLKLNKINLKILNKLEFNRPNKKQFPLLKILNDLPDLSSLYETALVIINDYFVNLFLEEKITYNKMIFYIEKFSFDKEIQKNKKIQVKSVSQIINFKKYLSLKLDFFVYKNNSYV